eukprot:SM000055S18249  [mRNA]  locus=s55:360047:364810:+ [translate_table: standard]
MQDEGAAALLAPELAALLVLLLSDVAPGGPAAATPAWADEVPAASEWGPTASDEDEEHDDVEVLLRQFDLDGKYGPCLGVTRVQRWQRASKLGLDPPAHVRHLLEQAGGQPQCLWEGRV